MELAIYTIHNELKNMASKHGKSYTMREELIKKLGSSCIKCGFSDPRALQIDHINGGGTDELKQFGCCWSMYKFYVYNPDKIINHLQLLCANCNWIKKHEKKENRRQIVI
jgi:hypothetical protein